MAFVAAPCGVTFGRTGLSREHGVRFILFHNLIGRVLTLRVLIFSQQFEAFRSGVGTYTAALVAGLLERGHQICLVTPKREAAQLHGLRVVSVPDPMLDPTPGGWISLSASFARRFDREAGYYDVAHFTDARESWRTHCHRTPATGMVNDSYALDWLDPTHPRRSFSDHFSRGLYYRFLRVVEKHSYRRLSAVVANSRHVANALVRGYDVPSEKVHTIHPCLPTATPVPDVDLPGRPSILFVGGNLQRKGLPLLLAATARLRTDLPGIRIHVIGQDGNQAKLEKLARDLEVGDAVRFHGWQPNDRVRGMMARADVFALPSLTEAFGLVYLEAMRAGLPVIATTNGGAREVFGEGREALFVNPNDVEGLVAAVRKIVQDPSLADRLCSAGRVAAARFSPEAMARETEEVFRKVLQDRGTPWESPFLVD